MFYFGGYPYSNSGIDLGFSNAVAILAIAFFVFLIVSAIALVFYFFQAFALYRLSKNRNMSNAYLAFIPVANMYLLGKIADNIYATMQKKTSYARKILVFTICSLSISLFGSTVLAFLKVVMPAQIGLTFFAKSIFNTATAVFSIIAYVYICIALYRIYKEYSPKNATVFTVLSILLKLQPFFLFAIRNNKSGYEKWMEERDAYNAAQRERAESINQVIDAEVTEEEQPKTDTEASETDETE